MIINVIFLKPVFHGWAKHVGSAHAMECVVFQWMVALSVCFFFLLTCFVANSCKTGKIIQKMLHSVYLIYHPCSFFDGWLHASTMSP